VPSVLIGHRGEPGVRVEFTRVLAPEFDPAIFRGKIVVVAEADFARADERTGPRQ
jgi:hypothetical protein